MPATAESESSQNEQIAWYSNPDEGASGKGSPAPLQSLATPMLTTQVICYQLHQRY